MGGIGLSGSGRFTLFVSVQGASQDEIDADTRQSAEDAQRANQLVNPCKPGQTQQSIGGPCSGGGSENNKKWVSKDWKSRLQQTTTLIHQLRGN